jgi:uncharacterized protein YbaA (DUF1428 family)
MTYIDGMMAPVNAGGRDDYRAFAQKMGAVFREYGALRVVDSWGSDVPDGKRTDMKRAVAAEEGETVAFGWVEWPDKATRDAAWEKIMKDPRMGPENHGAMPMDGARMIFGGFEVVSDIGAAA